MGQSQQTTYPPQKSRSSSSAVKHPRMHWSGKRSTVLSRPVVLSSGDELSPVEVAYETWGRLNDDKTNAILICHGLSGDAHVADGGVLPDGTIDTSGWWSSMVGPGKPIDTNHYFVICSNVLGGCSGTTGPSSTRMSAVLPSVRFASVLDEPDSFVEEKTSGHDVRYGTNFPLISVDDMVCVQKQLLDTLAIPKLACVIGASLGGMQALAWTKRFPGMVKGCIALATAWHATAQSIAFNEIGRQAILGDPWFERGQYHAEKPPKHGLAVAQMLSHITHLSAEAISQRFGVQLAHQQKEEEVFCDFKIESTLAQDMQGITDRFDANSYLYLTKALDSFALLEDVDEVARLYHKSAIKFLLLSFSNDWLFPTEQIEALAFALTKAGVEVSFTEIAADAGHDSYLVPNAEQSSIVSAFLSSLRRELGVNE